jgi:hypothetical protein
VQNLEFYIFEGGKFVKENPPMHITGQLSDMNPAGPPGMTSKILSSGFSHFFIGKGGDHDHRRFLVLSMGCGEFEGQVKAATIRFFPASLADHGSFKK